MTLTDVHAVGGSADFTRQRPIPDNLVPDLNGVNAFSTDKLATSIVAQYAPWAWERAATARIKVWDPHILKAAHDAQRYTPQLRTLDRIGNEAFDVEFHPAYHELMTLGFGSGVHSLAWTTDQPGAHSARAVLSYLWNQIDGSTACPIGMAYASIPVLRSQPELTPWATAIAAEGYDPADVPIERKSAGTIGYFMTEKHGGSDLRANVTVARPVGRRGPGRDLPRQRTQVVRLGADVGRLPHRRTDRGRRCSCLLVPRRRPTAPQRHQDQPAQGQAGQQGQRLIGDRVPRRPRLPRRRGGKGVRTILSSAEYTRLDFADRLRRPDAGRAVARRSTTTTTAHAFGSPLSQLPIQAPCWPTSRWNGPEPRHLGFRVARAEDARTTPAERLLSRLLTPWRSSGTAGGSRA